MVQRNDIDDSDKRSTGSAASDTETVIEEEWQALLQLLRKSLKQYNRAKTANDQAAMKKLAKEIEEIMRKLADSHSDSAEQAEWTRRANEFSKASDAGKENMLLDIGKGLGIIIAAPFILAGGVLYGTGLFVKGLGNLLTGGAIGRALNGGN
ncbi:MFS general substrate transporter [Mycena sanguinolenta]|uniref:MFS general substrate transporter n=1 Tax=Mycena sanguinolenta TaxID=230812 RepID=A0A8H6ZKN7_9AGAR|nr:MFS general substrate transporter [Mycena sanguinolenta]